MAKLKVFRTSIGFHDAYVASPSQKAALEAWGSDKNLFAMGAAEVVTDPALTAAPLATPGKVVKVTRGSLRDHLSAAGPSPTVSQDKSKRTGKPATKPASRKSKPATPPPPRPSRGDLDTAEAELKTARAQAEAELAEIDRRQAELHEERKRLEARQTMALRDLERRVRKAKAHYDRALERWRAS